MPIGKERLRRLTMRRSIGVMASELFIKFAKLKLLNLPYRDDWLAISLEVM